MSFKKKLINLIKLQYKKVGNTRSETHTYGDVQCLKDYRFNELIYSSTDYNVVPLFYVDPNLIYNKRIFCFGRDAWHPFTALLREYKANKSISYEDSILKKFYDLYQPNNLGEAIFIDDNKLQLDLKQYSAQSLLLPWTLRPRIYKGEKNLGPEHGYHNQGPVSDIKGDLEFSRLIKVYSSIESRGFKIDMYKSFKDHIRGFFLRKGNEWRFVIISGHHRVAAMSELNYDQIPVTFQPTFPRAINYKDLLEWPQVKNGNINKITARKIFLQYFEENGIKKAKNIGVI